MKKPEELQETAENKVNEIPKDGVTESPAADLAAITASGVQAVETVTEDAPALQSGEASFVESVAEELSEKGLLEPVPEVRTPKYRYMQLFCPNVCIVRCDKFLHDLIKCFRAPFPAFSKQFINQGILVKSN